MNDSGPVAQSHGGTVPAGGVFDSQTAALVRLAVAVAVGDEKLLAQRVGGALAAETPKTWVEELLLQSILMVGYPRVLVATGVWRQVSLPLPPAASDRMGREDWTIAGERICRIVYGDNYDRLRSNVAALHPTLDDWMISEGYGRVLSRPGLDLARRELCTVAQLAVLRSPRQLHSHLRGALNAGSTPSDLRAVLEVIRDDLDQEAGSLAVEMWEHYVNDQSRAQ